MLKIIEIKIIIESKKLVYNEKILITVLNTRQRFAISITSCVMTEIAAKISK
jgi:hypothetical protein